MGGARSWMHHQREAWDELTRPGAPFGLATVDVRGVPMRVFEAAPADLRAVWEQARTHGDRTYLVYEDERYSYAEIDERVRSLAHLLREAHGVREGDRVAIAMRNYPEWVVSYWAVLSLGAAVVGMNAWWTGAEMAYGLRDARPKVLICDDERLAKVLPQLAELRADAPLHVIAVRSDRPLPGDASRWLDVVDPTSAPAVLPEAVIDPDDDACIFYTSGTTGFPKGAQLTHRGSVTNIWNLAFLGAVVATALQREHPDAPPAQPTSPLVTLAPTPLFHVTANNCILHPTTVRGDVLVLMYKWDPGRALELIERERVTAFSAVPAMSRDVLLHPDWQRRDTSSLRGMGGGGAAMHPDLSRKIDEALPEGMPATGYGLTETTGIVTSNLGPNCIAKPTSVGPVVPTLDARLVDEAGDPVPPGPDAVGRLCVRGTVVIKGYLNRPDATADAIRDGWFDTGDIVRIDEDGFVHIVDRAKDMVLRGGENIYCSEVETAIHEHDAVAEVAVFGVPDERLGEEVGAAVVLRDGATLDAAGLREFLAERLAPFKVPRHVWFRTEPLPRNANGKFVKRELRDQYVAGD